VGPYQNAVSVGNLPTGTVANLAPGLTYYFAVTVVDQDGNESDYSNEASYTVPGIAAQPAFQACFSPNGGVALFLTGVPGHSYEVDSSYDTLNWVVIDTITMGSSGFFSFIDSSAYAAMVPTYVVRDVTGPSPNPPTIQVQYLLSGGQVAGQVLDLAGNPGDAYDILSSPDLTNWTLIGTKTVGADGTFEFVDDTVEDFPFPYYRLRPTGSSDPAPPALQISYSASGEVALEALGQAGQSYQVVRTTDHVNWTVAATGTTDPSGVFWAFDGPGGTAFPLYELRPSEVITAAIPAITFSYDPSGQLAVTVTGQQGYTYQVLASSDLIVWTLVAEQTVGPDGSFTFIDPNADPNNPPFYQVRAIQNPAPPGPRLAIRRSLDGRVNLEATGCAADRYEIQATKDFLSWQVIGSAEAVSGALSFTDEAAATIPVRFYRLHQSTAMPPVPAVLRIGLTPEGYIFLHASGRANHTYQIQATEDLRSWSSVAAKATDDAGQLQWVDYDSANHPRRFYRLEE
jgi:hypothetical protein